MFYNKIIDILIFLKMANYYFYRGNIKTSLKKLGFKNCDNDGS